MARIVLGHRDGALATRQARTILTELNAEWPDMQIVLRQVAAKAGEDALLQALANGHIGMAMATADSLPTHLPEGVVIAAISRRLEPRVALVARGRLALTDLAAAARVRVYSERDLGFVRAALPGADVSVWNRSVDDALAGLVAGEHDALLFPGALLIALDRKDRIDALLEPEAFPPAPGQGAMALLVRDGDDAAAELAYTLQHRPSFDRVRAERAFAAGLHHANVGALASLDADGDLNLFGAVVTGSGAVLQASSSGDAKDAAELGAELASDVTTRMTSLQ